ncbi:MAG: CAAX prenyl protease-related protein [Chthoniobacterales bacterium]|nr:CAAX prenyl protease-related protein [Chthoniobacterales bacterium]MCX7713481.1 CAAX prenyl protease-related protein [Chthoniobacterales bacterium]
MNGLTNRFSRAGLAHVLPFAVFMAALGLASFLNWLGGEDGAWWLKEAKYWVYPIQTLLCGGLIVLFWREYDWGCIKQVRWGISWGAVVFFLWVSPQMVFGAPPRLEGFNPYAVGGGEGIAFWISLLLRMLRLTVVVPIIEEIFWRSFLMRWFIAEKDWQKVKFGTPNLGAFSAVVILFAFVHSFLDIFGAIAAGVIYGYLALKTRSLAACVTAHAVTNLLLGVYILWTQQWGFW